MDKLPVLSGEKLLKALLKEGFVVLRQKGSHVIVSKEMDGEAVSFPVPLHKGRNIKPGTLNGILHSAGISKDRLKYLLTLVLL